VPSTVFSGVFVSFTRWRSLENFERENSQSNHEVNPPLSSSHPSLMTQTNAAFISPIKGPRSIVRPTKTKRLVHYVALMPLVGVVLPKYNARWHTDIFPGFREKNSYLHYRDVEKCTTSGKLRREQLLQTGRSSAIINGWLQGKWLDDLIYTEPGVM